MMKKKIFFRRSFAYCFDCIIIFALYAVTQLTIFSFLRQRFGMDTSWFKNGLNTELYTLLTISIPAWLYFAIFNSSKYKGSPGKLIMHLSLERKYGKLSFWKALIRTIIKLLPWEFAHIANNLPVPLMFDEDPDFRLFFVLSGITMLIYIVSILTDKDGRCVYDKIFQTVVALKKVPNQIQI